MPTYPYHCTKCKSDFDVVKMMSDAGRVEECPDCGNTIKEQSYSGRRLNGFVSTEGNWSGGKKVGQLHPSHPAYHVSSKKQMEDVYKRNGISMDTGHFESKEAQVKGTTPRKQRTGNVTDSTIIGGVQENSQICS